MKLKLIILSLLFVGIGYSQFKLSPKIYFDAPGTYTTGLNFGGVNREVDIDTKSGFTIGLEGNFELYPIPLIAGIGFNYQIQRSGEFSSTNETADDADFNFMPLYATIKVPFINTPGIRPMIVANLGYNVVHDAGDEISSVYDLAGGLYWALGLRGEIFQSIFVEAIYQSFGGESEFSVPTIGSFTNDVSYKVFSLGVGINL